MHWLSRRRIGNQLRTTQAKELQRKRRARVLCSEALERRDLLTTTPTLLAATDTPIMGPVAQAIEPAVQLAGETVAPVTQLAAAPLSADDIVTAAATTLSLSDHGQLIANPGAGWQAFYNPNNTSGFPTSTVYARFDWSDIEPVVGQYNFSQIDQLLSSMSNWQRLALRIMTFHEDSGPVA